MILKPFDSETPVLRPGGTVRQPALRQVQIPWEGFIVGPREPVVPHSLVHPIRSTSFFHHVKFNIFVKSVENGDFPPWWLCQGYY